MKQAPSRARSIALVVVASVAFSLSGPLARWARPTPPLVVAFGRVALAGALLALVDVRGVVRAWHSTTARARGLVVLAGALLGAHFGLFIAGLDRTSLPAGISLIAIEPVSVVLAAWLFHRVRPSGREAIGVGVASAGGLVVASGAGAG
ncbi:MAG: EamA family transporter, partial [Polyangiales bacterium]